MTNMPIEPGTILYHKGTVFKDTNVTDPREYGHPCLIIAALEEYKYYLTMTSKMWQYGIKESKYFQIEKDNEKCIYCNHKCSGYINCQSVYRAIINSGFVCNMMSKEQLKIILEQLIYYQEQIRSKPDEYYGQIEGSIKSYLS